MIYLISIVGLIIAICILRKKSSKIEAIVDIEPDKVTIMWLTHKIVFKFSKDDDMIFYHGAECDEKYSASLSSSLDAELPWKLWAKCGDDEITILTNLKSYKVI